MRKSTGFCISTNMSTFASKAIGDETSFLSRLDARKRSRDIDMSEPKSEVDQFFASEQQAAQIEMWLRRIPPEEATAIYLWVYREKRQAEIAKIFGVTQAAISYRITKGRKRLQFLMTIPDVTVRDIEEELPKLEINHKPAFNDIDVAILIKLFETTCQSDVAKSLGVSQGKVRLRFTKAITILGTLSESKDPWTADTARKYHKIFHALVNNFNIFRQVKHNHRSQDLNEVIG